MHMNKAFTKRFLSIFANKHWRGYNATIILDPNRTFGHTFSHFYKQFGIRDEAEIEQNRDDMCKPWNIAGGWEFLKDRFELPTPSSARHGSHKKMTSQSACT